MLVEKLKEDIIQAMKNQDKDTLMVLRMAKGAIDKEHIDKKVEINDNLLIECISREIKQRKESIEEFRKGNREDLVNKTQAEIEILERYLPEQLTDEEILKEIDKIFDLTKPTGIKDMGKVMKEAATLKGKADMAFVSNEIRNRLNNIKD